MSFVFKLNNSSSLSFSPYKRCSKNLIIFDGPSLNSLQCAHVCLVLGTAVSCLCKGPLLLMFTLLSTGSPGPFLQSYFPVWSLACPCCMGLFLPACRTSQFPLLNFMGIPSAHLSHVFNFIHPCIFCKGIKSLDL